MKKATTRGRINRFDWSMPELVLTTSSYTTWSENGWLLNSHGGHVWDLGLAEGPGEPIILRQECELASDFGIIHHAYSVGRDHPGSGCGEVKIRERLAYDNHYRSEIPLTGVHIGFSLTLSAFQQFRGILADLPAYVDLDVPKLILRFPITSFVIPPSRGGLDPVVDGPKIGRLQEIARAHFEYLHLEVVARLALIRNGISDSAAIIASHTLR